MYGTGALVYLILVGDAVVIAVHQARIGAVALLGGIGQAVAVIVLVAVQHSVAISILAQWISAAPELVKVVKPVAVIIGKGVHAVDVQIVAAVQRFPPIRQAVGVGVIHALQLPGL